MIWLKPKRFTQLEVFITWVKLATPNIVEHLDPLIVTLENKVDILLAEKETDAKEKIEKHAKKLKYYQYYLDQLERLSVMLRFAIPLVFSLSQSPDKYQN